MSYHIGTATISTSLNCWNILPSISILFYWCKILSFNYLSRISSMHSTLTHGIFTCNQLLTDCLTTLGFILRRVHILLTGFKMSKPHLGWLLCITVVFLDTLQDRYLCHTLFFDLHAWPCRLHLPHSSGSSLLHLFAQPSLVKSPSLVCLTFTGQVNSNKIYLVLPSSAGAKSRFTSTSCACTISTPGISSSASAVTISTPGILSSASAVYTPVILTDISGSGSCTPGFFYTSLLDL